MRKILVGMWITIGLINAGVAVNGFLAGVDGAMTMNQGVIALLSFLIATYNYQLGKHEEAR